jgi:hypothetical protein
MPVEAPTSHTVLPRQSLMGRLWGMVMGNDDGERGWLNYYKFNSCLRLYSLT